MPPLGLAVGWRSELAPPWLARVCDIVCALRIVQIADLAPATSPFLRLTSGGTQPCAGTCTGARVSSRASPSRVCRELLYIDIARVPAIRPVSVGPKEPRRSISLILPPVHVLELKRKCESAL